MEHPSATTLSRQAQHALSALRRLGRPSSGRRVAAVMEVAPATANRALRELEGEGLAQSSRSGRSQMWTEVQKPRGRGTANLEARPPEAPTETRAALILTALELEYEAIARLVGETTRARLSDGTRIERGAIVGMEIGWSVAIAEVGMGNVNAAAVASNAIRELRPDLVLFVGVAGGLKPSDQEIGDVVVADRVYNHHSAKQESGGTLTRPQSLTIRHRLRQHALTTVRDLNRTSTFHSAVKPIVSGEQVLADPSSPSFELLRERFNDAAAVDMESYGVAQAADIHDVPALAVRGLSDLVADKRPERDAQSQPIAARNAAEVAYALLGSAAPGDFTIRTVDPTAPPQPPQSPEHNPASLADLLSELPPGAAIWFGRSQATSLEPLRELAAQAAAPATWLGRVRHRPPAWLRDDASGNLWALVGSIASAHDHSIAEYCWSEASTRADASGDHPAATWLRVLAQIEAANASDEGRSQLLEVALRALASEPAGPFDDVVSFFSTAIRTELEGTAPAPIIAAGQRALATLGLRQVESRPADEPFESRAQVFDEALVRSTGYSILLAMSRAFIALHDLPRALSATREAEALIPGAANPRRTAAFARLAAIDWEDGTNVTAITKTLRAAEEDALTARARGRVWHGPTGEDLALAGRARVRGGDPNGALQLLLPRPQGRAEDDEARHPNVRAAATQAALLTGRTKLATELATGIEDPVERDLATATAYSLQDETRDLAEEAFRRVMRAQGTLEPEQLVRALLGLVRIGAPIDPSAEGTVAKQLDALAQVDPEAADLVRAHAELEAGRPQAALQLARRYPDSPSAVDLAAQAAVEGGRPADGVRLLDRAGRDRGEEFMRARAMEMATRSGREDDALGIAADLASSSNPRIRRQALEARAEISFRRSEWPSAADLCRELIDLHEAEVFEDQDTRLESYRWAAANALYHLRKPAEAIRFLEQPTPLSPRTRDDALLALALLRVLLAERSDQFDDAHQRLDALNRAIEIAKAWDDDEAVLASALSYVMLGSSGLESITPGTVLDIRELQERFFAEFPKSNLLTRIEVGEDLENLVEYVRASLEPSAKARAEIAQGVWLGRYPLGLLAEAAPRSYAEMVIMGGIGCIVAVDPDGPSREAGRAAARAAVDSGSAAVDVSALVMVADCGVPASTILATFSELTVGEDGRDDILDARSRLSMFSGGSLGWDSHSGKPTVAEYSAADSERWLAIAEAAVGALRFTQAVPSSPLWPEDDRLSGREAWTAGISAARQLQIPLWADDAVLRKVARSLGVQAFGTLELAEILRADGVIDGTQLADVIRTLRRRRVVDIGEETFELLSLTANEGFDPGGYGALVLSRPATWTPVDNGFRKYTAVVRQLGENAELPVVAGLARAALVGAAHASSPAARGKVVGALVVWTLLSLDRPAAFGALLDAAEVVLGELAPAADSIEAVVSAFTTFLGDTHSAAEALQVVSRYAAELDEARRLRVLSLLIGAR